MNQTSTQTSKYLKYATWGCLYLVLLTPLMLSSRFLFPFITLKVFYFRIIVEVAVFLYLLLALADSYYRPKMNKLLWFILGFGLIIFIAGILGVNPYRSFWGNIERGEGFLTISHLIAFCFIISQVFRKKSEWLNFLTGSLFVSVLVAFYALAQRLNMDWTIHAGEGRLSSTLGNAAYLGAYALGNFWICLILFLERKQLFWKIILGAIALFEIYILFQTQTRGAMLAFFITLFVLGVAYIFLSKKKENKIIFSSLIIILICSALFIWFNREQDWIKQSGPLHRIANISLNDVTTESRFLAWDSSWNSWKDRFLLGYGWENYNIAFNKYFHAEIYRDAGSQIWFDRAHNTVFDVAVATGVIGLIAYLGIFIFAFIVLIKRLIANYRARSNINIPLILMAFLSAHFMQNIFVFDCLATYIMMFSIFGMIIYFGNEKRISKEGTRIIRPVNLYAVVFGGIILTIILFQFNFNPAKANQIGLNSLKLFYQNEPVKAVELLDQAIEMKTYQTLELRQKFSEQAMNFYNNDNKKGKDMLLQAIDEIKNNIEEAPLDAQNYLYLMALYNIGFREDPDYLNQVIISGKKVLKLSPTRPQIYFEMGRASINMGRADQGIDYFKKAVALNPKTIDSRWNLLSAYILTGQQVKVDKEYQEMLDLGLNESEKILERLERTYASVKNYPELVKVYQKFIELDNRNVKYWMKLAGAYKGAGEFEKARIIVGQIIKGTNDEGVKEEAMKFLEGLK